MRRFKWLASLKVYGLTRLPCDFGLEPELRPSVPLAVRRGGFPLRRLRFKVGSSFR